MSEDRPESSNGSLSSENAAFAEQLLGEYLQEPSRVSPAWRRGRPQSEVSRRRMVFATTAGNARFSKPELCGMRISKLKQSVFSVTAIMRAT